MSTFVSTATVTPQQTFDAMERVVRSLTAFPALFTTSTTLQKKLLVPELRALISESRDFVFPFLRMDSSNPYKLVPLQLLCQGTAVVAVKPLMMEYQLAGPDLRNVRVKLLEDQEATNTAATVAYAAEGLYSLMSLIEAKFLFLQNMLDKIRERLLQGEGEIKQVLLRLSENHLPNVLSWKRSEYTQFLSVISLTHFVEPMHYLANLLDSLQNEYVHKFSVIKAAFDVYNDVKDQPWFACVPLLLPANKKFRNDPNMILDLLYNYMVGYYLTNDLCVQVSQGWFVNYSLRKIVLRCQKTENLEHRAFFEKLLGTLTTLCSEQSALYPSLVTRFFKPEVVTVERCKERLKKSAAVLGEIARLVSFLETWRVPKSESKLEVMFSDASQLVLYLATLEARYLLEFVPQSSNFAKDSLAAVKTLVAQNQDKYNYFMNQLLFRLPQIAARLGWGDVASLYYEHQMATQKGSAFLAAQSSSYKTQALTYLFNM